MSIQKTDIPDDLQCYNCYKRKHWECRKCNVWFCDHCIVCEKMVPKCPQCDSFLSNGSVKITRETHDLTWFSLLMALKKQEDENRQMDEFGNLFNKTL